MKFPKPTFSVDTMNERKFTIQTDSNDPCATKIAFELNIEFHTLNLQSNNLIQNEMLHFYTPNDYERLQSITQPSYKMLLRVVKNINSIPELIELLVEYIECVPRSDVEHLSDFILKDIKETLDGFEFTDQQLNNFGKSVRRSFSNDELSHSASLNDWFTSYRDNSKLGLAKTDILVLINRLQLKPEQQAYFSNLRRGFLLEQSCSVLAHALLYVPVDRLKNGLKKAKEDKLIEFVHDDLIDFIHDRTHVPMESTIITEVVP